MAVVQRLAGTPKDLADPPGGTYTCLAEDRWMPAYGPAEGSAVADGHPAQVNESAELPNITGG
jgi:hypothetical protein